MPVRHSEKVSKMVQLHHASVAPAVQYSYIESRFFLPIKSASESLKYSLFCEHVVRKKKKSFTLHTLELMKVAVLVLFLLL